MPEAEWSLRTPESKAQALEDLAAAFEALEGTGNQPRAVEHYVEHYRAMREGWEKELGR